jgi:D-alanine-D-alanine ligase
MKKILLIFGGNGTEGSVSRESAKSVRPILTKLGYELHEFDFVMNEFVNKVLEVKPDVVFNCMHGKYGEDGVVQAVLNSMKVAYTHSGFQTCTMAINKSFTKQIAGSIGIPVLESNIVPKSIIDSQSYTSSTNVFLKPNFQGSSICSFILKNNEQISQEKLNEINKNYESFYIAETLFKGKEMTVAIINNTQACGVEIVPSSEFFSHETKYTKGASSFFVPPRVNQPLLDKIYDCALKIHKEMGCNYISRSDFLVNEDEGKFIFLEINTHPGFTSTSLAPKAAAHLGYSYEDLIAGLIQNATFEQ